MISLSAGCPAIERRLLSMYPEYDCDVGYYTQGESHVYEISVETPGRLEIAQCDSPNAVDMRLFRRTSNASRIADWEVVPGFDDGRCSTRCQTSSESGAPGTPVLVTWWLDPGELALVIDYNPGLDTDPSTERAMDYTVTLRAAVNPTRGAAGAAWTDPLGFGLASETLRRVGAVTDASAIDATAISLNGEAEGICCGQLWGGIAHAPSTGKLYAAPFYAGNVLIVNPDSNGSDIAAMGGLGHGRYESGVRLGVRLPPSPSLSRSV